MDDNEPTRRDFLRMALTYAGVLPVAALVQRCAGNLANNSGRYAADHRTRHPPQIEPTR